jgi:hypothetical protein
MRAKLATSRGHVLARRVLDASRMSSKRPLHPLEHHPSFRAVVAAAPPVAELAHATAESDMVGQLAIACGDLASGFAAPPGSTSRVTAHRRAWVTVRELDRTVTALRIHKRAPAAVLARAQRAIDRVDVMIEALLPG